MTLPPDVESYLKSEMSGKDNSATTEMLKAAVVKIEERDRRIEELEGLVKVLVENDPNEFVSDGGHTVLDLWRSNARATLSQSEGGG